MFEKILYNRIEATLECQVKVFFQNGSLKFVSNICILSSKLEE